MPLKIIIVEDEPLIASDIEFTIKEAGHSVLGVANSSIKALDMINTRKPDLVLLDISIKGEESGIDIGNQLKTKYSIPFIYITSFADQKTLAMAKETLPYGYIVKPFKDRDIVSAIEMAAFRFEAEQKPSLPDHDTINTCAHQPLTKREYDIALRIWEGKNNNDIAAELFLSLNTVKTHTKNLFTKTAVKSRSELIAYLRKL